ncbi:hypothetical protein ON010_g13582 [Phytophthora cinnamomi]|nr:hypothetical protein ON010_g13582 [Phytophthora cinnamomi]
MRFMAQMVEISSATWRVQVKLPFYGHNDSVARAIKGSYPSIRLVPASSPVTKGAERMVVEVNRAGFTATFGSCGDAGCVQPHHQAQKVGSALYAILNVTAGLTKGLLCFRQPFDRRRPGRRATGEF